MFNSIRNTKVAYSVYNMFNRGKLKHNLPLYRKYGIRKKYFSPISGKDFSALPEVERHPDTEALRENRYFKNLSQENQAGILEYDKNGFALIRRFITPDTAEQVNAIVGKLLKSRALKPLKNGKIMFAILHSSFIRNLGEDPDFLDMLSILMDGKARLFQSINFMYGSEQKTHSDSIHMTTYPLGGLIGLWIALEDVNQSNGALHYYPGSHKLPYYFNSDYDNEGSRFFLGNKGYGEYEKMLANKVKEYSLEKKILNVKKGDAFIWHANILHGGEPHSDKSRTRKSMVFHYFDEGSICYHEITQRPALFR